MFYYWQLLTNCKSHSKMSLCSIIPTAPLTDAVFPFNNAHFNRIREYQARLVSFFLTGNSGTHRLFESSSDLLFLSSPVINTYTLTPTSLTSSFTL